MVLGEMMYQVMFCMCPELSLLVAFSLLKMVAGIPIRVKITLEPINL